jgi:hypothetical protein
MKVAAGWTPLTLQVRRVIWFSVQRCLLPMKYNSGGSGGSYIVDPFR